VRKLLRADPGVDGDRDRVPDERTDHADTRLERRLGPHGDVLAARQMGGHRRGRIAESAVRDRPAADADGLSVAAPEHRRKELRHAGTVAEPRSCAARAR
jgi:hypothetical protein